MPGTLDATSVDVEMAMPDHANLRSTQSTRAAEEAVNRSTRVISTVLALVAVGALPSEAQDRTRVDLSVGAGVGTPALAGQLSLAAGKRNWDVIVRFAGTTDFNLFGPSASQEDSAVLYGRRRDNARSWYRVAAGVGQVLAVRSGDAEDCFFIFCSYERLSEKTLGLAVQADAVWAPLSALGLGVGAFGNLNSAASFAGLTINLHLGRIR